MISVSARARGSLFVCSLVKGNRRVLVDLKVFAVFDGLILVDQPSGNGNHADLLVDQSNPSLGILHCINLSLIVSAEALKPHCIL